MHSERKNFNRNVVMGAKISIIEYVYFFYFFKFSFLSIKKEFMRKFSMLGDSENLKLILLKTVFLKFKEM